MEETRLKNEIQDAKDQNELLEFRILELEVSLEDLSTLERVVCLQACPTQIWTSETEE